MFLKFGIASNEIIMRIVLGKSENLQNKGYRRSTSKSGHTPSEAFFYVGMIQILLKRLA